MPDRAFGIASVKVEPTAFTQTVAIDVPKEVRSGSKLTVGIDAGKLDGDTWATVAVVDEGILSLTRFKTPDPLSTLFPQRALGVETYETIGWTLLVPPQGNSRSTGGDEEGGSSPSGRVQPVKPVALWSGLVKLSAEGKAKVDFQVPQYRGSLRVMVVTAGKQRIGRAQANVTVRDPITLQTTLPRFLSYGDRIEIPVFVTNVSGKALEVKVQLVSENLAGAGDERGGGRGLSARAARPAGGDRAARGRQVGDARVPGARGEVGRGGAADGDREGRRLREPRLARRAVLSDRSPRAEGAAARARGRAARPEAVLRRLGADHRALDDLGDLEPLRRVVRSPEVPDPVPVRLHRADDLDHPADALRLEHPRLDRPHAARGKGPRGEGDVRREPGALDADPVRWLQLLAGRAGAGRLGHRVRLAHADRREEGGLRDPAGPARRRAPLGVAGARSLGRGHREPRGPLPGSRGRRRAVPPLRDGARRQGAEGVDPEGDRQAPEGRGREDPRAPLHAPGRALPRGRSPLRARAAQPRHLGDLRPARERSGTSTRTAARAG